MTTIESKVSSVTAYKDSKNVFHETKEGAMLANIRISIESFLESYYYNNIYSPDIDQLLMILVKNPDLLGALVKVAEGNFKEQQDDYQV